MGTQELSKVQRHVISFLLRSKSQKRPSKIALYVSLLTQGRGLITVWFVVRCFTRGSDLSMVDTQDLLTSAKVSSVKTVVNPPVLNIT